MTNDDSRRGQKAEGFIVPHDLTAEPGLHLPILVSGPGVEGACDSCKCRSLGMCAL